MRFKPHKVIESICIYTWTQFRSPMSFEVRRTGLFEYWTFPDGLQGALPALTNKSLFMLNMFFDHPLKDLSRETDFIVINSLYCSTMSHAYRLIVGKFYLLGDLLWSDTFVSRRWMPHSFVEKFNVLWVCITRDY
jgi:hypothetical protein